MLRGLDAARARGGRFQRSRRKPGWQLGLGIDAGIGGQTSRLPAERGRERIADDDPLPTEVREGEVVGLGERKTRYVRREQHVGSNGCIEERLRDVRSDAGDALANEVAGE